MAHKELKYDQEARAALEAGVDAVANAVKVTLGPKGRYVVLDKKFGAPTITNDGVTIAREIEVEDVFQNQGAQLVREVATATNDVAGDGTTTATVLAQAIVRQGLKNVAAGANPLALKRAAGILVELELLVSHVSLSLLVFLDRCAVADDLGQDVRLTKDQNLVDAELDLGAAVLAEDDLVALLEIHGDVLAVLVAGTGTDGKDAAALRLLPRRVRQDDPADRRFLFLEDLYDQAIAKRLQIHRMTSTCDTFVRAAGTLAMGVPAAQVQVADMSGED